MYVHMKFVRICRSKKNGFFGEKVRKSELCFNPSITDGVHHNENFVEIIPVFSTFSKFFKVFQKIVLKSFYVTFQCCC